MKFAALTSRAVAGGATAALAVTALVGATGTAAHAAPVSTTYSCTAVGQTFNVPVTVDITLPATGAAGLPVPAGMLGFSSSMTVPNPPVSSLSALGATGAKSDDFGAVFGKTVAKSPVAWDTASAPAADGSVTYSGKGANAAFELPKAGKFSVTMPKEFSLVTTGGATPITAQCTTATPAEIGTITLSKQVATVKAKAPKAVKKGAVVAVKGKIKNEYGQKVKGKVVVKDGKKTVGTGKVKKGKYVVKVKGLAVGSHQLTVAFKGDGYTDKGTSKAIKVNVKR